MAVPHIHTDTSKVQEPGINLSQPEKCEICSNSEIRQNRKMSRQVENKIWVNKQLYGKVLEDLQASFCRKMPTNNVLQI